MRTCPNCGKDTSAEMTAPCTKCGFSPAEAPDMGTTNYGGDAPTDVGGGGPTTERKRRGVGSTLALILVIIVVVGFDVIADVVGDLNIDLDKTFEPDPGPTASEVEGALVNYGEQVGATGLEADCPESAKEAEVGESFECTVSVPSGASRTVKVTNGEDQFEWQGQPFAELAQAG